MLYKYLETHILNLILTSKYYNTAEEVAVNGGRALKPRQQCSLTSWIFDLVKRGACRPTVIYPETKMYCWK